MWRVPKHLTKRVQERPLKNAKAGIKIVARTVYDDFGDDAFWEMSMRSACSTDSSTIVIPAWYAKVHEWIDTSSEVKKDREYHLQRFHEILFRGRGGQYLEKFKPLIKVLTDAGIKVPPPGLGKKAKKTAPKRDVSKSPKRGRKKKNVVEEIPEKE
jgi:hypothetical protein